MDIHPVIIQTNTFCDILYLNLCQKSFGVYLYRIVSIKSVRLMKKRANRDFIFRPCFTVHSDCIDSMYL